MGGWRHIGSQSLMKLRICWQLVDIIGDIEWKIPKTILSPLPDVFSYTIEDDVDFIVLATDTGLWNSVDNETVSQHVRQFLLQEKNFDECAEDLMSFAITKGCNSDVTVCVLKL